ncbi:unnamed protein product [Rhizophagus irregularis]|nr:unnamed protein product [Rhizophagus irregularis]
MFFQKIFTSASYHSNSSILPSDLHLGSASVNLKISNKTAWNFSHFLCYFKSQAAENYPTGKPLRELK